MSITDYFYIRGRGATGATGSPGSLAWHTDWITATVYHVNDFVYHIVSGRGKSLFRCTTEHTSSATNEPSAGASYTTVWEDSIQGGVNGGTSSGDVLGPASSVAGHMAVFHDTSGKQLDDGGAIPTAFATTITALTETTDPPSATADYLPIYDGSAGTLRKIKVGTLGKRKVPVEITSGALIKPTANYATDPSIEAMSTSARSIRSVSFNYDQKRYMEAQFTLPDQFDSSHPTIDVYFNWYTPTGTSAGVRWVAQATGVGDHESLDATWGVSAEVTDYGSGTAKQLLKSTKATITVGGSPQPGDLCCLRIYRDPAHAADTYDSAVNLVDVKCVLTLTGWTEN